MKASAASFAGERTQFKYRRSGVSTANAIYIIDCLGDADLQTGRRRLQDVHDVLLELNTESFEDTREFAQRFEARTADEFIQVTNQLAQLIDAGIRPILFIDGHGHPDRGLRLASNEYVHWKGLLNLCQRIIQVSHGELTVIVAACHSMAAIKHLDETARLPFSFYYGYPSSVEAGTIANETQLVAESLLRDGGRRAIEATLKLNSYSEYDHVILPLTMGLLLSQAPQTSAKINPELSRNKLRQSISQAFAGQGYPYAGLDQRLNAALNEGRHIFSLIERRMHDTGRRARLIEDVRAYIRLHTRVVEPF